MWWMIAAGVVAFLILLYVIGKRDIARDEDAKGQRARRDGVSTPNLTAEKPLVSQRPDRFVEEQEVVFYANNFHGYFTNDGLDTLLTVMQTREMRELEAAIDKLELDVGQLSRAYAGRHGTD